MAISPEQPKAAEFTPGRGHRSVLVDATEADTLYPVARQERAQLSGQLPPFQPLAGAEAPGGATRVMALRL